MISRNSVVPRLSRFLFVILVAPLLSFGQLTSSLSPVPIAPPQAPKSSLSVVTGPMPIIAGDLLNIAVFDTPELSGQVRVGENGITVFPLIGAVNLNGLSPEQAQRLIEKRLRDGDFVRDPQVTIIISEYASQAVTIMGEVTHPGIYPLVSGNRLFDVISQASGFTLIAGTKVSITHRGDDKPVELVVRGSKGQIATSNVELASGDTIVVQRAGIVYVIGDVGKPGGFVMDREHITVLEAIALALGTTKTSSLNKARLLRKTEAGFQQSPLPLKSILSAKMSDPILQDGDIIYVPSSAPKTAMQMGLQGILSSAAGSSIYLASGR